MLLDRTVNRHYSAALLEMNYLVYFFRGGGGRGDSPWIEHRIDPREDFFVCVCWGGRGFES